MRNWEGGASMWSRLLLRVLSREQAAIGVLLSLGFIFLIMLIFRSPLHIPRWSCSIQLENKVIHVRRGMTAGDVERIFGAPIKLRHLGPARSTYREFQLIDKQGKDFRLIFIGGKLSTIEEIK